MVPRAHAVPADWGGGAGKLPPLKGAGTAQAVTGGCLTEVFVNADVSVSFCRGRVSRPGVPSALKPSICGRGGAAGAHIGAPLRILCVVRRFLSGVRVGSAMPGEAERLPYGFCGWCGVFVGSAGWVGVGVWHALPVLRKQDLFSYKKALSETVDFGRDISLPSLSREVARSDGGLQPPCIPPSKGGFRAVRYSGKFPFMAADGYEAAAPVFRGGRLIILS